MASDKSKALHAFEQKLIYFDDDLELMDIIRLSSQNGLLSDPNEHKLFKQLNPRIHTHINRRYNSNQNRTIVINHLRQTLYSSYIKDLYEEFSEYLRIILNNLAISCSNSSVITPEKIVGQNFKSPFLATQLLECGNWDNVVKLIIDTLFQSLENERSTKALIMQISRKLDVNLPDNLINEAMPYLDTRHVLVHADGKPSQQFKDDYPMIKLDNKGYIKLDLQFCQEMKAKIFEIVKEFDRQIMEKNILLSKYKHTMG